MEKYLTFLYSYKKIVQFYNIYVIITTSKWKVGFACRKFVLIIL